MTEYGCSACDATFPADEYQSKWRALHAASKHVERMADDADHADAGVAELTTTEAAAP